MIKKLLSTTFVIAAGLSATAQITVTATDVGSIGDQVQQAVDTLPPTGIMPGPKGANQTWNFNNLSQDYVDVLTFTNPNWTPDASSFPNANLAVETPWGHVYMNNQVGSATIEGVSGDPFGLGVNMVLKNTPPELMMTWPAMYNNTSSSAFVTSGTFFVGYTDPSTGAYIDSAKVVSHVTKLDSIDAWGSLTTPLGTYNVLRVKEFRRTNDTVFAKYPFIGYQVAFTQQDSSLTYSWWTNGMDFPVVQFDMDIPNDTVQRVTWLKANTNATGIAEAGAGEVSIYPNPASDELTLSVNTTNAVFVSIYDMTGKKLRTIDISSSTLRIDVRALSAGVYFYSVTDQAGAILKRSTFTVSR